MNARYKRQVFLNAAKVAHLTYQIGELDLLRKKSKEVDPGKINSTEIKNTIKKLRKTLSEYKKLTGKGRGVSAVQIGIPLKIAVIFAGRKELTLINPKIISKSSESVLYPEICMSANPIVAEVIRPLSVKVEYLDEKGVKVSWDSEDKILNRVIQHEIDHMEGIVNIDLVSSDKLYLDTKPDSYKKSGFKKV